MNTRNGIVASLIATLMLLCTSTEAFAQGWTSENFLQLHEYRIEERGIPCGNAGQIAPNGFVLIDDQRTYQFEGRTLTGPQFLNILAERNPTSRREWRKTDEVFTAWKPGTPGTANVWRVQMPFACSHTFVAEGEKLPVNGVLVNALDWMRTQPATVFQVDEPNGGVSFAAKLPLIAEVNGAKQAVCPTGTRPMYRVYNGGIEGAVNDGNHRYFTNWRKLDETLSLAGWEVPALNRANNRPVLDNDSNPETGMLCLPAEVKSLWTKYGYAADSTIVGNNFVGTVYGQFDLMNGTRRDVFGVEGSRALWFDSSLQEALSPDSGFFTAVAQTTITQTAQVPLNRLTAIPHERSNTIVHVSGNQMIWGYNRTTGAVDVNWVPSLPQGEQGVQALQVGDWLWVASCVSSCDGTVIRLYDQRSKARIYEQVLPYRTAQGIGLFASLPNLAFSPEERALYVASRHTGKVHRVHLPTRNVVEMLIPQGVGVAYGATDVKVDTLNKQVLVTAWTTSTTRGKGKLVSYPYGSSSAQYTVDVGGSPWALELGAYGGSVHAFVSNSYDDYAGSGEMTDTISVVNVVRRVHVRKLASAEQPTGLALVF